MKYLRLRNDFLNNNQNLKKINEDSGPLANDIPWGDSLVGRLINSVIRKATIGADLLRMDDVISKLKSSFESIISNSMVRSNSTPENAKNLDKLLLSAILGVLRKSIDEEGDSKPNVIKFAKNALSEVRSLTLQKESEDDRKEIVSKLNEFIKSVEEEVEKEELESLDKSELMISNLNSLSNIIGHFQTPIKNKLEREKFDRSSIKENSFYLINLNSKIQVAQIKSINGDVAECIIFENGRPYKKTIKTDIIFKEVRYNIEPGGKADTVIFNKEDIKSLDGKFDKVYVTKGSIAPKKVLESLITEDNSEENPDIKKSVDMLIKNDKGLSINQDFINSLIKNYKENPDDRGSNGVLNSPSYILKNIYKEVYSCLKGDRSKTVSESLETLRKDRYKIAVAGELIAKFYKKTSKLEINEEYKKLGDIGNEIHSFNTTLSSIMSGGLPLPDYRKSEDDSKKESVLRYSLFSLVNESDESSVKDENIFKSKFNKIFNPNYLKKWEMTEDEISAFKKNMNSVTPKSTSKIVIEGIDPIVEIVKIFNRAYKLHTVESIPSGRDKGRVSERTKREYMYMGDGSTPHGTDVGSKGPWRNKALYDKWEDAVLDIIKDPKYQVLFNEDTTIKVGSSDPRINIVKKDGVKKQGGGKTLLTFINSMLDGSKLYKGGAQTQFIKDYFDADVPSDVLGYTSKGKNDTSINSKVANRAVKDTGKKKYSFKTIKDISQDFIKSIYAIKMTDKKYYMYISSKDENYVYVKYSESFFPINKYLTSISEITKGDMDTIQIRERKETDNNKFELYYARIRRSEFPIKPGDDLDVNSLNIDKFENSDEKETIQSEVVELGRIEKIYSVLNSDNKMFILPDDKSKSFSSKDEKYRNKLK